MATTWDTLSLAFLDLPPPQTEASVEHPAISLSFLDLPPDYGPAELVPENIEWVDPLTPEIVDIYPEDDGVVAVESYLSFRVIDRYVPINPATIAMSISHDVGGTPETIDVIVAGAFQPSWSGSITANSENGYDVVVNSNVLHGVGEWTALAQCSDDGSMAPPAPALTGSLEWGWLAAFPISLVYARPIARRTVELGFDGLVRCHATALTPAAPADRYIAVDWIAAGGAIEDAVSPANYVFSRPEGGSLSFAGEAIPLNVTWADTHPDAFEDVEGVRWSNTIWAHTDYDQTAHAGYRIVCENLTGLLLPVPPQTADFVGYIASRVQRGSLRLWDLIPSAIRRDDVAGAGDAQRFLSALQEPLDRLIEDIDAFSWDLATLDGCRHEFLPALLYDLGDPFTALLPTTIAQRRKLAGLLVDLYRRKGTCQGIVDAVRMFTGVECEGCSAPWSDNWIVGTGDYPASSDGSLLGAQTYLGPAAGTADVWSFWLVHLDPASVTAEQRTQISVVVAHAKPAYAHYLGLRAP